MVVNTHNRFMFSTKLTLSGLVNFLLGISSDKQEFLLAGSIFLFTVCTVCACAP